MLAALRRQGDQYLSAEQAGARYRAGLQGEGENLVRLIDYYNRLTDAQRRAEQVSLSAQRVALTSNSDALRREVLSGVSGRIGVAEGARRRGIVPIIPHRSTAKNRPKFFPKRLYKLRARVEQLIGKIKRFKRVAMRCEKTQRNYAAFIALACVFLLVKSVHRA